MRILDTYILRSIIGIFLATILIFLFLYILIDSASHLDELIRERVPLDVLLSYYASFCPIIFTQTAPIAILIAILFTFSRLNNQNEVIALRAGGLNFWQITKPALWFGALIAVFIFWVNERFVPTATLTSEQIKTEEMTSQDPKSKKKQPNIKHLTFYGLRNRLYFIETFNPNNFQLEGITIIGQDNQQNLQEKIVALKGQWTGIAWKFSQAQVTTFNPQDFTIPQQVKYYEEKLMDVKETPQDFLRQRINVSGMNIRRLVEYIERFSHSGANKALNSLRVELHQKIAFPMGTIAIILIGLPFALKTGRRKAMTFTALGLAIAIGFLFYVVNAISLALGKGEILPPMIAAWIAPVIFIAAALYLIQEGY